MKLLRVSALAAAPLLAACSDQNVSALRFDAIAVVQGDFDNVTEPLTALEINTQAYNGFIVQATYEPDDERTTRDDPGPTVESLLTSTTEKGQLEIGLFNAVFVNSGTRGLGAVRYNDLLEPDDSLLADTEAMDNACKFAEGGGTLVVSDWAYDLVEYCWPDNLELFGDDATPDAAQAGMPDDSVLADVKDEKLVEALGEAVNLTYDYTAWTVIESVNSDTEVLLSGTVEYQPSAEELPVSLENAPLMVRFKPGRGQVVFTTFHWTAQTPDVAQTLLLEAVEGLYEGAGDDSTDAVGTEEGSDA